MNDIEVLEDYIYNKKDTMKEQLVNAIENLLKERQSDKERIKELEEELKEKDMQHELELIGKEEYTKASMGEIIEQYYTANEDCIPTSLIKEKIEELKQEDLKIYDTDSEDVRIAKYEQRAVLQVLEELLKGE